MNNVADVKHRVIVLLEPTSGDAGSTLYIMFACFFNFFFWYII